MSTTFIIIIVVLLTFTIYVIVSYYRMKHMKPADNSDKLITLGTHNFKLNIRQGISLVDFWAPWCSPCKIVAPILNEIAESESGFKVGKVNVDEENELAQKYNIKSIPTFIIFKNGVEVRRFTGIKTKKFFLREICEIDEKKQVEDVIR